MSARQTATGWLIRSAYQLDLRRVANDVQRELAGENKVPRTPLPTFATAGDVRRYVSAYWSRNSWREDRIKAAGVFWPLDWSSHPEVFHTRLLEAGGNDGDCDDFHTFYAHCLETVPDVEQVVLVSSGIGWREGHTCCAYRIGGQWFHVDYLTVTPIPDPNEIPRLTALDYSNGAHDFAPWYVFETTDFKLLATGPDGRLPQRMLEA